MILKSLISWIALSTVVVTNLDCNSNGKIDKKNLNINSNNSINSTTVVTNKSDTIHPKNITVNLADTKKIEILSLNNEINRNGSHDDINSCKSWTITTDQFKKVIGRFKPMASEYQYLAYLFYPCEVTGNIKIDSNVFKYWLGSGATLTLKNSDTTLYFGCPDKKCKKYFISIEQTEKELEE